MSDSTESPAEKKKGLPNLLVRVATALFAIPVLLWMLFGANLLVFAVFAGLAAAVGASELGLMVLKADRPLRWWMVAATLGFSLTLILTDQPDYRFVALAVVLLIGPLSILMRPDPISDAAARMGWLIAGPLYLGGCFAAIALLHQLDNGGAWVVLSMGLAWMSDTGGYFAGRAFGRHKLYEKISPKKTVEGSIGGLAAIVAFALGMKFTVMPELPVGGTVLLALVGGAVGQAGDLCVSVIKRSTGVKDSGFIIPGHGGILDRVDALLFTAPVTLIYARLILGVTTHSPAVPLL